MERENNPLQIHRASAVNFNRPTAMKGEWALHWPLAEGWGRASEMKLEYGEKYIVFAGALLPDLIRFLQETNEALESERTRREGYIG